MYPLWWPWWPHSCSTGCWAPGFRLIICQATFIPSIAQGCNRLLKSHPGYLRISNLFLIPLLLVINHRFGCIEISVSIMFLNLYHFIEEFLRLYEIVYIISLRQIKRRQIILVASSLLTLSLQSTLLSLHRLHNGLLQRLHQPLCCYFCWYWLVLWS